MTPKGENNTSPDKTETQSQERQIKNNGFKIYTWTVNNKDDINFVKKLKVDGIISDYPDRI